jgi:hypothetical protein
LNHEVATTLFQETLYQTPSRVMVVMQRNWDTYTPDEKILLAKILAAVKLELASVQIISQAVFSLPSVSAYAPSRVVIFGSTTEGIKPYEAVQAQGLSVLKADDLSELDDSKKKSLWLALKTMFGI